MALAVVATVLLAAPGSAQAGSWIAGSSTLVRAADTTVSSAVQVGMDGQSRSVAVWAGSGSIYGATRAAGSSWSAPQVLGGSHFSGPSLAVNANGDAVAAWTDSDANYHVRAAYRPAGGSWSAVNVATSSTIPYYYPKVSITPTGEASVVWSNSSGAGQWGVYVATRSAGAGGAWTSLGKITNSDSAGAIPRPAGGFDSDGNLIFAWDYRTGSATWGVRGVSRTPLASAWPSSTCPQGNTPCNASSLYELAGTASSTQPTSVNVGFSAYEDEISWIQGNNIMGGQYYPGLTASNVWGGPYILKTRSSPPTNLRSAVRPSAGAILAWNESGGVFAARSSSAWATIPDAAIARRSAATGATSVPSVAVDATGAGTVVWGYDATVDEVHAVRAEPSGFDVTWSTREKLGETPAYTSGAAVGAGANGDASVLSIAASGDYATRTFDGSAPGQSDLSVPSQATAGRPMPASVNASDAWGSTTTEWTWGDGTTSTGASTSHSYANSGVYTVQVKTTDAAGNKTISETRTVEVVPDLDAGGSTWLPPLVVAPSSAADLDLAVNVAGDAIAAWGTTSDGGCQSGPLRAITRTSSSGWSAVSTIADGCDPSVAMTADGTAIAVWRDADFCPCTVYGASRPPGGAWTTPTALDTTVRSPGPALVATPQGTAWATWPRTAGAGEEFAAARWSGASWSTPAAIPSSAFQGSLGEMDLASNSQGAVVAAWEANDGATVFMYAAKLAAGAGTWGTTQTLDAAGSISTISNPDVAAGPDGDFHVIWDRDGASSTRRNAASSSSWDTAASVVGGNNSFAPVIGVGPDGTAVAAWRSGGANQAMFTATRAAGSSTWSTAQQLTAGTGSSFSGLTIDVDGKGNAFVAWRRGYTDSVSGQSMSAIEASRRTAGSASAGAVQTLSSDSWGFEGPVLGANGSEDVTAGWIRGDAQSGLAVVEMTAFDPVAPTVAEPTLPGGTVYAGTPYTYSASATDLSGTVTYSWSFDGGAAISGQSVTHTFPHASPHTVVLRVRDGAGNVATVSRTIEVTPAPTPPAVVAQQGPAPPPGAPALPAPVLGKTINVYVLKEPVSIKLPGTRRFRPLRGAAQLPNGTVIDTRKGRVLVVISDGKGGTDSAEFYEGLFEVNQPKRLKGLANIFLDGGGFKGCPRAPKDPHAQVSAGRKSKTRSVRHLWAKGEGKFRTVGRFSSATVRGTWWLTDDRCNGTRTKVRQGKVAVRDFVTKKTVLVRGGRSYFARR